MADPKISLYNELSASEIFLEEENHIYINKTTNKFYNSVTGIISFFNEEFDETDTIAGLRKQYQAFYNWYFKIQNGDLDNFINVLSKYVNYRQFTDKEQAVWQGKEYTRYLRKITDYVTIGEFLTEYNYLETINTVKRRKNIYLTPDFNIMDATSIKGMWQDMTNIANQYGNLVHLIIERHLLKKQGFLFEDELLPKISAHYFWIKNNLPSFYIKYPHSKHSFEEYEIDLSLNHLMEDISEKFDNCGIDLGICTVPEKRLLYNELAGTKDIDTHLDNYYFNTGDNKTNKDFTITSPFNNKMKPPFHCYEDSHLMHYTLQLSLYSYMQEKSSNKKVKDLYITYYNRKYNDFKIFDIEYKKEESEYLLNYYNDWINERKKRFFNSSLGGYIKSKIKEEWMDHFAKNFYFCIAENKDKDKVFFMNYINEYAEKHKNIKIC